MESLIGMWGIGLGLGLGVALIVVIVLVNRVRDSETPSAEPELTTQYGAINPAMICPHCQQARQVRTKHVERQAGISGDKAAAAVLTGGLTMLASGLSRSVRLTRAFCGHCKNVWEF